MADGSAPIIIPPDIAAAYDWTPQRKRIVVGFAGGGGSSLAIAAALGVHPDAAINHWIDAILGHSRHFPGCAHYHSDIFEIACTDVLPGEEIGLAWFSPDCRHFSKAKGGAPVSPRVRGLAWVVIQWAKIRQPDVIMMENVEEWLTYGPLIDRGDGKLVPDPARQGMTAKRFLRRLAQCGYAYEIRVSSAADYGDPQTRRRMLLIARRDGLPIVWPEAEFAHRDKAAAVGLKPHVPAASFIDFSRRCPSIFLTSAEAKEAGCKRPLRPASERRIALGLMRHTFGAAKPFIVSMTHRGGERTYSVDGAAPPVTGANRGELALAAPHLVQITHGEGHRSFSVRDAAPTLTTAHRGELALAAPHLVQFRRDAIGMDLHGAGPTVTANSYRKRPGGAAPIGLAAAHLVQMNTRDFASSLDDAGRTVPARAHQALAAAFLEQANTGAIGHDAGEALSTIVEKGCTQRLVTAQLSQLRGSNRGLGDLEAASPAIMAGGGHQALLTAHIDTYYGSGSVGRRR